MSQGSVTQPATYHELHSVLGKDGGKKEHQASQKLWHGDHKKLNLFLAGLYILAECPGQNQHSW